MNKQHKLNLIALAEVIASVPEKHWDISAVHRETACGSVGCALGWAGCDPYFQNRGLKWNEEDMVLEFTSLEHYKTTDLYDICKELFGPLDIGILSALAGGASVSYGMTERYFWHDPTRSARNILHEVFLKTGERWELASW